MDSDALPLSRSGVDRDARRRTEGIEAIQAGGPVRVLRVREGRVEGADHRVAYAQTITAGTEVAYLGTDGRFSYLVEMDTPDIGPGLDVRDAGWQLGRLDAGLAAAALSLANWHATHRFCPRCGAPTTVALAGWERHCTVDGSPHFPRTDPAVIMAIIDDQDRLLLGHAVGWPDRVFSVPAGFVEPGESLEAAVRREVAEETNVTVGDVTYRASQPWPFPASLMLGFRGRALTNDVRPDKVEMGEAMFVSRSELGQLLADAAIMLPRPTSIAHHLIVDWYGTTWPDTGWRPLA